jgi:hypothetical protein
MIIPRDQRHRYICQHNFAILDEVRDRHGVTILGVDGRGTHAPVFVITTDRGVPLEEVESPDVVIDRSRSSLNCQKCQNTVWFETTVSEHDSR